MEKEHLLTHIKKKKINFEHIAQKWNKLYNSDIYDGKRVSLLYAVGELSTINDIENKLKNVDTYTKEMKLKKALRKRKFKYLCYKYITTNYSNYLDIIGCKDD